MHKKKPYTLESFVLKTTNTDQTSTSRRRAIKRIIAGSAVITAGQFLPMNQSWGKTFLSLEQAQAILLPEETLHARTIDLSDAQRKQIAKESKVRVRDNSLRAWVSDKGNWFIVDQILGKHENIDMAVAINHEGGVIGLEVLTYRESYGHEIRHPKWRAQFHGKTSSKRLKLDRDIKNISGATLSCAHVTDGVNRLLKTWELVLSQAA